MDSVKTSQHALEEKHDVECLEASTEPLEYSLEEERKAVWKLDIVLIPL